MNRILRNRAMNMIWAMIIMLGAVVVGILLMVLVGAFSKHSYGLAPSTGLATLFILIGIIGGYIFYLVSLFRFSNVQPDEYSADCVRSIFNWNIAILCVSFGCILLNILVQEAFIIGLANLFSLLGNIMIIINYSRLSHNDYWVPKARTGAALLMWASIAALANGFLLVLITLLTYSAAFLVVIWCVMILAQIALTFTGWGLIAGGSPNWEESDGNAEY